VSAIEPIVVVDAAHAAASHAGVGPGWWALGLALVGASLAASALGAWLWHRSGPAGSPSERAFRAMSRRLGLSAEHRRTVRALADELGAPPVALVICRSAYERAVERLEHGAGGAPIPPARRGRLLEVHHRLFN
jgi:predicted signal transduction protein with EAL and GGDEF domain